MKSLTKAEQYIDLIGPAARDAMIQTGVPASFLIADNAVVSQFDMTETRNAWSVVLDKARAFRKYYPELFARKLGDLDLVRALAKRRYFTRRPAELDAMLSLMRRYRAQLQKWNMASANKVRQLKREFVKSVRWGGVLVAADHLLGEVQKAKKAGIQSTDISAFLQAVLS